MSTDRSDVAAGTGARPKQYVSPWLWVASIGALLQLYALTSDFYVTPTDDGGTRVRDAWFGIPHTSDLVLASALVAIVLVALTVANRCPVGGRGTGGWIGIVGLLASLQLGYRMIAPPFNLSVQGDQTVANLFSGDCQFYCSPSVAAGAGAELLTGIYVGIAGCLLVAVAGLGHALSRRAVASPARPRIAGAQVRRNPWLILAAAGAAGSFLIGYTIFPFYTTMNDTGAVTWSGWLPTPHTSSFVLALAVVVVGLVVVAGRGRSPLGPTALGATLAVLGLLIAGRIYQRILEPPFGSGGAVIEFPAYLSAGAGLLVVVAGVLVAVTGRRRARV